MLEAVETEAGKVRVAETKGRRKEERDRKETRRKKDEGKKSSKRMGDLG